MKKITALLLVLALILSLGACSKAPAEEATDAPTNAATDPATDAPTGGDTNPASYEWPMVGSVENVKIVEQEPEKPLRFAFLGYSNNSYWDLIYQGVDGAAEFLGLHNVTIEKINLGTAIGAEVMNNALEACMLEGYDGIIATTFVTGCENYINQCVANGIPVGIIGGEGGESDRAFVLAQNSITKSTLAADMVDKKLGGNGGKFAVIVAQFSMEVTEKARNNFIDILEGKGYECVGSYEAHDSADECYALTEQILTANPDIDAIYCLSGGTYGMPKAVVDAGKVGEVYLVGHDETAENLVYVRDGVMDVIGQNPAGYAFDAFMLMYNIVVAGQYPTEKVIAAAEPIITPENVNELFPEN